MCEFCLKHGEGKTWYLEAKSYSEDLLSDVRRRRAVRELLSDTRRIEGFLSRVERLDRAPRFVRAMVGLYATWRLKRYHFGQVVPIEDVERILEFVNSIVRVACLCRRITLGKEKRCCYAISMGPDGGKLSELMRGVDSGFLAGPDASKLETLAKDEALAAMRDHEREGMCHTIWTFRAPFIGGICNCDRMDCVAMRCAVSHNVATMFRAEYVARVDPDACVGCRECMRVCQFGAIGYSAADRKAVVDPRACYGCGVCRGACAKDAVRLLERRGVAAAANRW